MVVSTSLDVVGEVVAESWAIANSQKVFQENLTWNAYESTVTKQERNLKGFKKVLFD